MEVVKSRVSQSSRLTQGQEWFDQLEQKYGLSLDMIQQSMQLLPSNYEFEVPKTILKILDAKEGKEQFKVALQFPEGLLLFSTLISDIIEHYCQVKTLVMGDVTYGACCIDDLSARALDCDFMVHYAHSCLVPIQNMVISKLLYVFVDIKMNIDKFLNSLNHNLPQIGFEKEKDTLYLLGTVQFSNSLHASKTVLEQQGYKSIVVPQTKPRTGGEVLGCTAPTIPKSDDKIVVVFLADGRFHIESTMIQNDHIDKFYQYCPYANTLTEEQYDIPKMQEIRQGEIAKAEGFSRIGIILGTLGRQGAPSILETLQEKLDKLGHQYFVLLLSEITPQKLKLFKTIDVWVQIACPRLSVDWGHYFEKPLLNPYEAFVLLKQTEWRQTYPMDFYTYDGGEWSVYYKLNRERKERLAKRRAEREAKKQAAKKIEYEPEYGQEV